MHRALMMLVPGVIKFALEDRQRGSQYTPDSLGYLFCQQKTDNRRAQLGDEISEIPVANGSVEQIACQMCSLQHIGCLVAS